MTVPFRHVLLEFGDAQLAATNRDDAWVVESLGGWFGGVGVKGDRTARLGHGDFSAPNKRTGRSMTLNLLWVGDSGARDHVSRALSGLFSDGEEGTLTATVGDLTLTAERVTLDGEVGIAEVGTVGVRAQIPLHAADPFLYGPERETTLKPIGAGVGLEYPLFNHYPDARRNVVANHDFSTGLDGWTAFRAEISRIKLDDEYVARITSTTDTATSSLLESIAGTSAHPVAPGQVITASCEVLEMEDVDVDALAYFYDAAGTFMHNTASISAAVKGGEAARPVGSWVVPEGAAFVRLMLARAARPAGDWADVSRVSVEVGAEATSGNYFGAILGEPIITYGSAVGTTEHVWNDGNAESFPVFTVTADAPGGFSVALGNERVTYPWPAFPDMPVSVDMSGALTVSGMDQTHLAGRRDWASVPPASVEAPTFEFLQGGTGFCVVTHRDTYL